MTNALFAENYETLYQIHQKEFNIGFMNIQDIYPENLESFLIENFDKIPKFFRCSIEKNNFAQDINEIDNLYSVLGPSQERDELINFVKTLISHFADITDSPELGLSIERVDNDLCKFFHCDMNHLRLVYPLIGPGTLWVEEENVNRNFLGQGRNDLAIIDQQKIHQTPDKAITLLKGQGHPSAMGRAVVHASPVITKSKEPRILLRIESLF